MHRGYNLKLKNESFGKDYSTYKIIGEKISIKTKKDIEEKLHSFINNGTIDGTKLRANWFPQINADVFISHSHNDFDRAISLAGWLRSKFGLTSFIDSCVWGYSNELQLMIDKRYSYIGNDTYDYSGSNFAASHVHMMLTNALAEMIDNTECVFFLNTPNSINADDVMLRTKSPWIYTEIALTRMIRQRSPEDHRPSVIEEATKLAKRASARRLEVNYDIDLRHLSKMNYSHLAKWLNCFLIRRNLGDNGHPLESLYSVL